MPLSRDYSLIKFYREAAQDLHGAMGIPRHIQKDLSNRAICTVSGEFYDLMSSSYMTDAYANLAGTHKYESGAGSTYTASSRTVTFTTPSANLDSTDIGKVIMFRILTNIYLGTIESIVSTSAVVFSSTVYPSVDAVINETLVCGTTLSVGYFSIASLRIMRTHVSRIELNTTVAGATIKVGTTREVDTFINTGKNSKTIIWALNGEYINFAIGADLVNAGTLTIRYPRVPSLVSLDADMIDLPDGTPIEIAIIYLRGLIQRRLSLPKEDNEGLLSKKIADLYRSFSMEANAETIKQKVLALK